MTSNIRKATVVLLVVVAASLWWFNTNRRGDNPPAAIPTSSSTNSLSGHHGQAATGNSLSRQTVATRPTPNHDPLDPEALYARLSPIAKLDYQITCMGKEKIPGTDKYRVSIRQKLPIEQFAKSPRQKQALQQLKTKCQQLTGLAERLDQDIAENFRTGAIKAKALFNQLQALLETDPEAAAELFQRSLTSPYMRVRRAAYSLSRQLPETKQKLFVEKLMTPLNQALGLDYFHPQQAHGWHLLIQAAELADCQRHDNCGVDSLRQLSGCVINTELCDSTAYDNTAWWYSPADMDYLDAYLQFLLAQAKPSAEWEQALLEAGQEPTMAPGVETTGIPDE